MSANDNQVTNAELYGAIGDPAKVAKLARLSGDPEEGVKAYAALLIMEAIKHETLEAAVERAPRFAAEVRQLIDEAQRE